MRECTATEGYNSYTSHVLAVCKLHKSSKSTSYNGGADASVHSETDIPVTDRHTN